VSASVQGAKVPGCQDAWVPVRAATVSVWSRIRRVWAIVGSIVFVVFTGWSLLAFRATSFARAALDSDDRVAVEYADSAWSFHPRSPPRRAGLVFFPGGMVDPVAYAPLMRGIAVAGYPALLIELPRRGTFGGADSPEVFTRSVGSPPGIRSVAPSPRSSG
jgi:hypothetical protein